MLTFSLVSTVEHHTNCHLKSSLLYVVTHPTWPPQMLIHQRRLHRHHPAPVVIPTAKVVGLIHHHPRLPPTHGQAHPQLDGLVRGTHVQHVDDLDGQGDVDGVLAAAPLVGQLELGVAGREADGGVEEDAGLAEGAAVVGLDEGEERGEEDAL